MVRLESLVGTGGGESICLCRYVPMVLFAVCLRYRACGVTVLPFLLQFGREVVMPLGCDAPLLCGAEVICFNLPPVGGGGSKVLASRKARDQVVQTNLSQA